MEVRQLGSIIKKNILTVWREEEEGREKDRDRDTDTDIQRRK